MVDVQTQRADSRTVRHLVSLRDLSRESIDWMTERALLHAQGMPAGQPLQGRTVGVYFALTSTRTRTAFTVGAMRLGAHTIGYGSHDLQLSTGETFLDTSKVLGGMLDALVLRVADDTEEIAAAVPGAEMAVINAMSLDEHPTQALADLVTMRQWFGRIENLRVLYVGEGNSTASALSLALARYPGAELHLRTPYGYGLAESVKAAVRGSGAGVVEERHDLADLPESVDVVYTTQWQTTGTSKPDENWRAAFSPFQVDTRLFGRYPGAVFMHDLPARRGDEVEAGVIDGPRSIVFHQAANKLYSAMAVLEWCLPPENLAGRAGVPNE